MRGLDSNFATRSSAMIADAVLRVSDQAPSALRSRANSKAALAYGRAMLTFSAITAPLLRCVRFRAPVSRAGLHERAHRSRDRAACSRRQPRSLPLLCPTVREHDRIPMQL